MEPKKSASKTAKTNVFNRRVFSRRAILFLAALAITADIGGGTSSQKSMSDTTKSTVVPPPEDKEAPAPRALKHYLNRVRYVAMYFRGGTGEMTRWERLISWFRRDGSGQKTENIAQNNSLHESLLVGMAAIHHVNPAWLDDDRLFNELSQNRNDLPEAIRDAIDIHNERFQNWPPKKEERDLFKKISAGIYVS